MSKKPVLVVMAAGMGSRYGGLKQIDPVGSCGEAILDFSLFDAKEAGFETAVIIIKESIREVFMETVGKRLEKCPLEIRYAYQELDALPAGFQLPEGRVKPWGTSHAVLCAKEAIDGAPFAVINADDYYGKSGFKSVFDELCATSDDKKLNYCMVGYQLGKTVTDNGSVTRGICLTENGYLTSIQEQTGIEKRGQEIGYADQEGHWISLPPETTVSMNFWGFTPSFFTALESRFPVFLNQTLKENPMKGEFLLPLTVRDLLQEECITVKLFNSSDTWYGVTHAADRPLVEAAIRDLTGAGLYPDGLWK